jgi:hypothetical protein
VCNKISLQRALSSLYVVPVYDMEEVETIFYEQAILGGNIYIYVK